MVHCTLRARRVHKFWRAPCRPRCPRHVWRLSNCWLPHHYVNVLHAQRANGSCRVLVYVYNTYHSVSIVLISIVAVYTDLMTGLGAIVLGFVAFGVLHINSGSFAPWQWCVYMSAFVHSFAYACIHLCTWRLMIITGGMTLITSVVFWWALLNVPIKK